MYSKKNAVLFEEDWRFDGQLKKLSQVTARPHVDLLRFSWHRNTPLL
jgi:hypothetical protein